MNKKSLAVLLIFITSLTAVFGAVGGGLMVYKLENMGLINFQSLDSSLPTEPMAVEPADETTIDENIETTTSTRSFSEIQILKQL